MAMRTITWIRTSERLPDEDIDVLTCHEEDVWIGHCEDGQWYDSESYPRAAPDYWAELPEAP